MQWKGVLEKLLCSFRIWADIFLTVCLQMEQVFIYRLKLFSEEDWKGTKIIFKKLFSKDNFIFIEHLPPLSKHNMIHLLKMFIA